MASYLRYIVGEADVTNALDLEGHPTENLPGGATVTLSALSADGTVQWDDIACAVADAAQWIIEPTIAPADLDMPGRLRGTVTVAAGDGRVWKFDRVIIDIVPDRAEPAEPAP